MTKLFTAYAVITLNLARKITVKNTRIFSNIWKQKKKIEKSRAE
jgi:hypothetical protein